MKSLFLRSGLLLIVGCASAVLAGQSDPLTLAPSEDTYLNEKQTGRASGRGEAKELQIYGGPHKKQSRALLKFDLSQLKAPPLAAILRLYAYNSGTEHKNELMRCHALVRDWSEKNASWDRSLEDDQWVNLGGDWDPTPVAGFNVNASMTGDKKGRWLEFDVTALVQAWVLKRRPNYGLVILFDPETTSEVRCRSKENGTDTPELKLAWAAKLERGAGMVLGDKMKPYGDPVRNEPVWGTSSLSAVKVGQKFSQKLSVRGGAKPYKFSAGTLPEGLALSEDGTLSGTPAKIGKFSISFSVAAADGRKVSKTLELQVQAAPPAEEAAKGDAAKTDDAKKEPAKKGDIQDE